MREHLTPRDLTRPFDDAELDRIRQREEPRPYHRIRKNVVHPSAAAIADNLKVGSSAS
jgi:hypothetical protein